MDSVLLLPMAMAIQPSDWCLIPCQSGCWFLVAFAHNGKQQLALSLEVLACLLARSGCCLFLRETAAQCIHQVHNVLRSRRRSAARDGYARLFFLEHLDQSLLVVIDKL